MTRRQPVAFFLGDVSFLADPKFRALQRRLPDPDDFNSAVGAFFIALAAARRNGDAHVDAAEETGSRFIPDLQAVGLLNGQGFHVEPFDAWAPKPAVQQAGGLARAGSAARDDRGHFIRGDAQQSRSDVQHESSISQHPSVLASLDKLDQLSPPLLSTPSTTARAQRGPDYCENPTAHRDRWIEPFEGVGLACLECAPRDPLPELVLA